MERDESEITSSSSLAVQEEHELKFIPNDEIQAKLTSSLEAKRADEAASTILTLLEFGKFHVTSQSTESIIDEYFDTDDLSLYKIQAALRVRIQHGEVTVTIKRLLGKDLGQFKRQELSQKVSDKQYKDLIDEGFKEVIDAQLPDLKGKRLRKMVEMRNERKNLMIERGDERYCLSFDSFRYTNARNRRESTTQMEIELEALSELAKQELESIRRNLFALLRTFTYSTKSKYERGVEYFSLQSHVWRQWLTEWNSGTGLAWLGILIGILSLVVGIRACV